jgi:hypothetical protein
MSDRVARFDKAGVRGDAQVTDEGYIRANAVVTRSGVFIYKNPDGTIRRELRHPDEVFKADSLESMKMIPITNGHPVERLVNAQNAKRLAVGYTGETIDRDDIFVLTKLVITDEDTVKEVQHNAKRELSLGYTVDLISEKGTYNGEAYDYRQENIKYNHLSLVDNARAGSQAQIALDSSDAYEITNEESIMAKRKIKIDQEELMVEKETADSYEKLVEDLKNLADEKARVESEMAMIQEELDKVKAERDALEEKSSELPPEDKPGSAEEQKEPKMDSAEFKKKVKERVKLEKLAETVLDGETFKKVESASDMDIKKQIILSKYPKANLDGKSEIYITARFDGVLEEIEAKPTVKAHPRGHVTVDRSDDTPNAEEARKQMVYKMCNPKAGGR